MQAYKDKLNEVGDKYPQLIKEFDGMGDAMVDTTKAEELLAQARLKTSKATTDALEA
jgi:hypothetical protein